MRSALITSVLVLLAAVPALATSDAEPALQARAVSSNKRSHRSHAQNVRKSSLVRRSTKSKKCVAKNKEASSTSVRASATVTPITTTTTKEVVQTNTGSVKPSSGGTIKGQSACNGIPVGATSDVKLTSGPNGSLDWLNCGIESGGWTPPHIAIDDLVYVNLADVAWKEGSPFKPCAPYISQFEAHAGENGFPAILLAAFAMQESTCNPKTIGGGGEQGMFQLSEDKCHSAPGGDCKNVDYNMSTAAKYIKNSIKDSGGNFLLALGKYNGWQEKLTKEAATRAAYGGCCRCQNNLDYLHQFLNGWIQGVDAYGPPRLGKYFNLDVCN